MIIGILQGSLLGSILKISMMRVLCRSVAPMRIQFMFKLLGMLSLQSLPGKGLISLSNNVHLKEKSLETVGNRYT